MTGFLIGPYLALDNILVGAVLLPLCRTTRDRRRLIGWFAGVEAAAPVVGGAIGAQVWPGFDLAQAAILLTAALALTAALVIGRWRPVGQKLAGRAIVPLALVLGLDNLAAGAGSTVVHAALSGLLSAAVLALAWGVIGSLRLAEVRR
ncbi:MAG: hypothetical protein RL367_2885 [Pseudomonadota bacterium]|jgi:hypothetical protein